MVALHCNAGARSSHLDQPDSGSLYTLRRSARISLMQCLGGVNVRWSKGGDSIDSLRLGLRLFSTKTATAPEVRIEVIVPIIAPIIRAHIIAPENLPDISRCDVDHLWPYVATKVRVASRVRSFALQASLRFAKALPSACELRSQTAPLAQASLRFAKAANLRVLRRVASRRPCLRQAERGRATHCGNLPQCQGTCSIFCRLQFSANTATIATL
jgi:hypothetical protein